MTIRASMATLLLAGFLAAGCGGGAGPAPDVDGGGGNGGSDGGGGGGGDGGTRPDAGIDGNGACIPTVEICGDRIDQNCDGRDTGCGDNDGDGVMACRAGDDPTRCDCDDSTRDVRPPFGALPGAMELCDGRDNDCNGRVDEHANCCEGCASLGAERQRADICLEDGACDCSTEPGVGPCPAGRTCCASGCTDTATDFDNCGSCNAQCTEQADRCVGGMCRCGDGPVCDYVAMCTAGRCG